MTELVREILASLSPGFQQLAIVSNPDGFLMRSGVFQELRRESPAEVVAGTAIQLRVHYELNLRRHPERKAVYILTAGKMLADISARANNVRFRITDLFPNFVDKQAITRLSLDELSQLYGKHIQGLVSAQRLQDLIARSDDRHAAETRLGYANAAGNLKKIDNPDWSDVATIRLISESFINAVEAGNYDEISGQIDRLNLDFQHYLDDTYWQSINANPILKPRCVNGIIHHIRNNYAPADKVALAVVDGMAFWQYLLLAAALEEMQIFPTKEDWTYSWLPSITCLSRQAIFAGRYPSLDYAQSPRAERSVWESHWPTAFPEYHFDNNGDGLDISSDCRRLALVTVELDEKMHSTASYLDLLALTKIWAKSFARRIKELKDLGFAVILTTDHGNVHAKGWRAFTPTEKAHLNGNASRGHRHAIFVSRDASNQFSFDLGHHVRYLHREKWFAIRDGQSFNYPGRVEITHGGSHLFECMIPFIKF